MRVAIISDTHFGDPDCSLIRPAGFVGFSVNNQWFNQLLKIFHTHLAGPLDYLVLAGDIFDFSISAYQGSYTVASLFFSELVKLNVAKHIIYLPGNHDEDIWHVIEHQVNVINRLTVGKIPGKFRFSVPGVLDLRENLHPDRPRLELVGVTRGKDPNKPYGDIFLNGLTQGNIAFNVAYPNLYIVLNDDLSILVTHGHYFETYWALLGKIAPEIAHDDKEMRKKELPRIPEQLSMADYIAINFPTNKLACTGIGQAGKLTDVVRCIQKAAKKQDMNRIEPYLKRLDKYVLNFPWWSSKEWGTDIVLHVLKKIIGQYKDSRGSDSIKYFNEGDKSALLKKYLEMSHHEVDSIIDGIKKKSPDYRLPYPSKMIFGHTHDPIPWSNRTTACGIEFCNTGGWLFNNDNNVPAEVFLIENGVISSHAMYPPSPAAGSGRPGSLTPEDTGGLYPD